MKRLLLAATFLLCTSSIGIARQDPADSPATKEDIQKYLEVMHSREMMSKVIDAMTKPMHQMMHEQYEKDKDKLPADFETRMNKLMDDHLKGFPWDEILQFIVPFYQKQFTKGDIDHLWHFIQLPPDKKSSRELPAITAESMQSIMPIMQRKN